jgi:UDP-glucose 4-epimerase
VNPILVTGASGFIGGHLMRTLERQGFDVVGVFHKAALEERRGLYRADLRDASAVERLFDEYEFSAVVHLAASGVSAEAESFPDILAMNTLATAVLARTALRNGVEKFIYVGTAFEYRPHAGAMNESAPLGSANLYGASKAAGWLMLDALCRHEGLPLVTFRAFSAYGPGENPSKLIPYVILQGLRRAPIRLALASQVRDYLFVEDLVEALRIGLVAPAAIGRVYNIGSGPEEAMSVRGLVEEILALMGAPLKLCWFDRATRGRLDPPYLVSDPTKAHMELGWRPRVRLNEGLRRTLEWFQRRNVLEISA